MSAKMQPGSIKLSHMDVIDFDMGVNGFNNSVLTSVSMVLTCMSAFFYECVNACVNAVDIRHAQHVRNV